MILPFNQQMSAIIRTLNTQNYLDTWQAMQDFTIKRYKETRDELWLVQHHSVYTLGLNGKVEHLLNTANIPVISSDRGGQVTYHGLGQVVIYTLLDIKRLGLNIRQLVSVLESAMIALLAHYQIEGYARADAPGVYVQGKKIGSIGIRIKNHCSYHGLSFNNDMDLTPFSGINPCGYQGLEVTQLKNLGVNVNTDVLALQLAELINTALACHALRDYHAKRDTPAKHC